MLYLKYIKQQEVVMITYKPLLKLLIDRNIKKMELIEMANISNATLAKLSKNDYVALEVIDKLCKALNCKPGDILDYEE
jgi:DNA-binding Xre family transcriptional regulator